MFQLFARGFSDLKARDRRNQKESVVFKNGGLFALAKRKAWGSPRCQITPRGPGQKTPLGLRSPKALGC